MASGLRDETAYAKKDFQEIYGRAPTAVELSQVIPAYVGVDQNIPNLAGGKSYIAQMFQATQDTPDKLYKKQQEEYLAKAPEHFDAIQNLFQSNFGRAATQEELNHFGSLLASGSTDPYQLQKFMQQDQEYTQKQDSEFQNKLSGQLAGYDKQYFQESILPSIQQAYAKQGRSFDSSAFQNAATQSAQAQNTQRQQYLAGLSAQQYGGRQANAYSDYQNMVGNQQNLSNQGIMAQYSGIQNAQQRGRDIQDYNTQAQAYNQYLAKYGKRSGGMGAGAGSLLGMGLGALLAAPTGGLSIPAGAMLGGAGGGAAGGLFDNWR